jgi:2-haloacid dehalogenase
MTDQVPRLAAKVCAFDAYGTLFDFNPASLEGSLTTSQAAALRDLWRTKQLQYFWASTMQGAYRDFEALTADALGFALEALQLERPGLSTAIMARFADLIAYPETSVALRRLRSLGLRVVIHTNATLRIVQSSVDGTGLADHFDQIISIDAVRHYKPHPIAYRHLVDHLGVAAHDIVFVSSNGWDAFGAAWFGFQSVWVNRAGAPPERLPGQPARVLHDLTTLPDEVAVSSI